MIDTSGFTASEIEALEHGARIKSGMVHDSESRIPLLWPTGCHGDPNIMKIADWAAKRVTQFVETGTDAGSTIGYIARMYPRLECNSCEADARMYNAACENLINHPNVVLYLASSTKFLYDIHPHPSALFWLDAHSHGWGCELDQEVAIVLERWDSGYIFMDDFHVPYSPGFGFDWYEQFGPLSWANVSKVLPDELRRKIKSISYPCYEPKKGTRGFGFIVFGDVEDIISEDLETRLGM